MSCRLLEESFPNDIASVPRARRVAAEASSRKLGPEEVEIVRLLTSELVTNCVQHGVGPISVTVDVDDHRLCVSVRDGGVAAVTVQPTNPDPGGHGLRLVAAMSSGWEQVSAEPTEVRFWLDLAG